MNQPIQLYSYFRSSASYRVRIALNHKGIKYEYKPVHLLKDGGEHRTDDFQTVNPMQQIPSLVDGDTVVSQSMAILVYLDKKYPGNSYFPTSAEDLAQCLQICEIVNSGIAPIQNLSVLQEIEKIKGSAQAKIDWAHDWIEKGFKGLEKTLEKSAGTYCIGGQVSAADMFLAPQCYNARRFKVDMDQFPTIKRVDENCMKLDSFVQARPEAQPDCPKVL